MKAEALKSLQSNTNLNPDVFEFPKDLGNLGWMKFCNYGIERSLDSEFILLSNDDILVPNVCDWASVMINEMKNIPHIGALGPVGTNVMGWQSLTTNNATLKETFIVPFLSFFFVLLRTDMVKSIGFLDDSLPGGDDLDYCFRVRDAGYFCAVTPKVFVLHYYAQTGKRIYGDYWDSTIHTENINKALITKYGFKKYSNYMQTI